MPKKKHWTAPTLSEVLADVNLVSVVEDFGRMRVFDGTGEVFEGSDNDVWQWLRDEGHHFSQCCECSRDHTDVELDLHGVCEDCSDDMERRGEREQRIADYESRGDYLRDSRKDADYYASGENWRGE